MTADMPYSRNAVEILVVGMSVKVGSGDLNPHIFTYPHLFIYMLFFLYGLFFIFGKITGAFPSVSDFQDLYFQDPSAFYIIARCAVVFFMAATVVIVYLIAKRAFNKKIANIAAAFMTFNIANVQISHYATTDIPVLFFSMFAFLFILKITESAGWRTYLLAGFLIGLAAATKYQAFFLVFSLILAHALSFGGIKDLLKKVFDRRPFIAFGGVFAGFFLGSPFCVLDYRQFLAGAIRMSKTVSSLSYGFATYRITESLPFYIVKAILPYAMGVIMAILCIIAVLYSAKKHTKIDKLFLGTIFIFLTYVIFSKWSYLKPRHIIHLFPLCFILMGRLLYDFSGILFTENSRKRAFLICITALILMPSFHRIWIYEKRLRTKPVELQAKEWVELNIPAQTKIASHDGIPIEPNKNSIRRKLREVIDEKIGHGIKLKVMLKNRHLFEKTYDVYELPYPWRLDYDEEDFDFDRDIKNGVKYFIFTGELSNYFNEPEKHQTQLAYYNSVKENCVLRKKFSSSFIRGELGSIEEDLYVLIYEYKKK